MTHHNLIRALRLALPLAVTIGAIYVAFVAFSFTLQGGTIP